MAGKRKPRRKRVGRVSYYPRRNGWHIYYRDGGRAIRRRVADDEQSAAQVAAQINAQLASGSPTLLAFQPVEVRALRQRFLAHHEDVCRSSLATIRRYRAATQHLETFALSQSPVPLAHQVPATQFVRYLRSIAVSPNGHPHSNKRQLRDKGIRFVIEVCRSLYGYATRHRHLPPYQANPFSDLRPERMGVTDSKPIFVFTEGQELAFLRAASEWSFPIHFTLAKTGLRAGELRHLLVEDLDLDAGWLAVRNKPGLGWRSKTGRERNVPLCAELVAVLRRVLGRRRAGPVFLRERLQPSSSSLVGIDQQQLERAVAQRQQQSAAAAICMGREQLARLARTVWRDAGAVRHEMIRISFIRAARAAGLAEATCPKSWRHTFATLLQDANVDPLIRQQTLGHSRGRDARSALGMTGVYSHSRPETQRHQIDEAIRRWPQSLALARQWAAGDRSR